MDDKNNKIDNLNRIIKDLEKTFGKGSAMRLLDDDNLNIESISSGSIVIDNLIGVGGYPKGRIIEIYGPESSGKTTISLHAIKEAQKLNKLTAFIDVEHALDAGYAKNIGIKLEELIISQPDSGEQALNILETLVKSEDMGLVVLDSVAALVPEAELEGEMGAVNVGGQARLMSKALRKLNGIISKTNCIVIFINQIREKIGVMFGSPETTPGGRALRFYSSVRLDIRKVEVLTKNGQAYGNRVKIKTVKNKVSSPFKIGMTNITYNKGIDNLQEVIEMAVDLKIIEKAGAWYSYENVKIGQGRDKVKNYLIENFEVYNAILNKLNILFFKN
ncbi:recombinase RecA [Spiroplasma endosymbiont of Anurida maritima]|uniref:recombinase RecA n=1 Tax=Spiroplasma endosymbiont of Anurida maritima TaxID=2967972 RepID=UPI0036D3387B